MRAVALALFLVGCAPQGRIRTPRLEDRLRTAWTLPATWGGADSRVVVLSNSAFPCGVPTTQDPDAITGADAALATAWTREGSVIVAFVLFSADTADWSGAYPVDEAASAWAVDATEPRAALAGFHAVWEAEIAEEDGLYREYTPVDEQLVLPVVAPGTIDATQDGDALAGEFDLASLDVSGRFSAEPCPAGQDDLLETDLLALLLSLWTSPPEDTGR